MTEQNVESLGNLQSQEPMQSDANTTSSVSSEEMVSKSRMNDIIHERTRQAAQKAREKAEEDFKAERERLSMGMGGMPQMSEDKIRSMMQEEFDKRLQKQREEFERQNHEKKIHDLANDFMGKIAAAKDKHPSLMNRQDEIGDLAVLVPYINETSEVAGITEHLLDNVHAFTSLLVASQHSPDRVRRVLKNIEASIKENNAALQREYPNEPLSQPSPSVTMDNGSSSIETLKKQDWLRG